MIPGNKKHKQALVELEEWEKILFFKDDTSPEELIRFRVRHCEIWMERQLNFVKLNRALCAISGIGFGWCVHDVVIGKMWWLNMLLGFINIFTFVIATSAIRSAWWMWKNLLFEKTYLQQVDLENVMVVKGELP